MKFVVSLLFVCFVGFLLVMAGRDMQSRHCRLDRPGAVARWAARADGSCQIADMPAAFFGLPTEPAAR